jgi:hypothetical protein
MLYMSTFRGHPPPAEWWVCGVGTDGSGTGAIETKLSMGGAEHAKFPNQVQGCIESRVALAV